MKLSIKFSNLLADRIARSIELTVDGSEMGLTQFVELIKQQSWGNELIEDDVIRHPVILIIDDELVQISNNTQLIITETSDINFQIMFAGG